MSCEHLIETISLGGKTDQADMLAASCRLLVPGGADMPLDIGGSRRLGVST